jgi:hypothetical protein
MADTIPALGTEHNPSATTTIALDPEQRDALASLLASGVMDTASNHLAALYESILSEISKNTPSAIQITDPMAISSAKKLTEIIGTDWDDLPPGTVDPQYPPWKCGRRANAHQGDYIALGRAILIAGLAARS